jgi:hypothetical protein
MLRLTTMSNLRQVALPKQLLKPIVPVGQVAAGPCLRRLRRMSRGISAATKEQTTSAQQISTAMEAVNELTQVAASAAEELSGSTEQLTTMAQNLQGDGCAVQNRQGKWKDRRPWHADRTRRKSRQEEADKGGEFGVD